MVATIVVVIIAVGTALLTSSEQITEILMSLRLLTTVVLDVGLAIYNLMLGLRLLLSCPVQQHLSAIRGQAHSLAMTAPLLSGLKYGLAGRRQHLPALDTIKQHQLPNSFGG